MSRCKPYLLLWILGSIMFLCLALIYRFVPFGHKTMLTIDLGQQYIDFFSLFKEAVTRQPSLLFYSFYKAIGGEMVGLWAYYLMSPFNWVLLLFDRTNFDLAVTLLIYLKVIASSLTFYYFISHRYQLDLIENYCLALSYSFMSYMVVYWLNIMWLDGLVLLPLIAHGLDQLLAGKSPWLYVLSFNLLLVAHYYIAYMVAVFLALYMAFLISEQSGLSWRKAAFHYLNFIKYSLIAVLMAGLTWIPTLYSLINSKVSGKGLEWTWQAAYTLQDILSKLFVGAFAFDEIKSGSPQLYAGSLVGILVLIYFVRCKTPWYEKVTAGLIFSFFYLSFRYELLDKLWHGGQFPIWYPFRFSFTTTFFAIVLAGKAFNQRVYSGQSFFTALALIASFAFGLYYFYHLDSYEFLSPMKLFISLMFIFACLLVLHIPKGRLELTHSLLLLVLVIADLVTNSALILAEFSYVDQTKFRDYTQVLHQATTPLKPEKNDFYRIHKTFMRTKNEAMYEAYPGLDHFGSTIEAHLPDLYGYLGLPSGSGFVTYSNGTLFTDDLFNIRYILDVAADSQDHTESHEYNLYQESHDLDNAHYAVIHEADRYLTYENPDPLGLVFEVKPDVATVEFKNHRPIQNQETLLSLIDFSEVPQPYFQLVKFDQVIYSGVEVVDRGDGDYYTYQVKDIDSDPYIQIHFTTQSEGPYYFTFPSQFDRDNVKLRLNGESYRFYSPFRKRQVLNASYGQAGPQSIRLYLKEPEVKANLMELYSFDVDRYDIMMASKEAYAFQIDQISQTQFSGQIESQLPHSYLLISLPYDKAWQAKVNGQPVDIQPVLNNTLMALPVSAGHHHVQLSYRPQAVLVGGATSLVGILLLGADRYLHRKNRYCKGENHERCV